MMHQRILLFLPSFVVTLQAQGHIVLLKSFKKIYLAKIHLFNVGKTCAGRVWALMASESSCLAVYVVHFHSD